MSCRNVLEVVQVSSLDIHADSTEKFTQSRTIE
jgi:hypothetical protein